jgi:2-polyprenyl-6-methoxyphenol hydroxylase-like FAD-dependent oxidoreductase
VRVIVAGGGIAGLAASIALRRHGHEVVVLERAEQSEAAGAAGAGITLFANAMRALDTLGVGEDVRERGAAARQSAILTASGRTLARLAPELLDGATAVHRAELHATLRSAAGVVLDGHDVHTVEQGHDRVLVRTAAGVEHRGELLVGADGLRSAVRRCVAPSAHPRYAGYIAWRGVSPVRVEPGRLSESWGAGERFGLVDIGSRTYWFATANTREGERDDPARRKRELKERFGDWHAPIRDVLEATPANAVLRNDVYFLDPLERWSRQRVVLIGDAAHATTPGVGQGAAQALEDAVALARELAPGLLDLHAGLARYEAARRARALLALKLARRTDAVAQLAHPLACAVRNALVARVPGRVQRRRLAPLVHGGAH